MNRRFAIYLAKACLPIVIMAATPVITLICIFVVWNAIDSVLSYRQTSIFIEQNRDMVARWRSHAKVHSFSLSHDPECFGRLLVQFDVEDKRTFERIESEIFELTSRLRCFPSWKTTLRSNEELGNDWGFAAAGMGEALKGGYLLMWSLFGAFVSFIYVAFKMWKFQLKVLKGVLDAPSWH